MRQTNNDIEGEKAVYHAISRTALAGLPFGDVEKDEFVKILKWYSNIYFADILGYAVIDIENRQIMFTVPSPPSGWT